MAVDRNRRINAKPITVGARLLAICLASLLSCASAMAADGKLTFSVAVVPQFSAVEIHRSWTPVLERLSRETGYTLTLTVTASIPAFEETLFAGTPDFAYMNPYHQVMAMRSGGYVPLVRDSKLLNGILAVRKDDPIKSVRELDGKEIAFPSPNAFGASLWMRALLVEREKINIIPVYVKTHSNAFRQVAIGKFPACGGVNHTLADEPEAVRSALRILLETPGVPPHPLSAHPRVPEKVRQSVADALLRMAGDAPGRALLADIQMPVPVRASYAVDYRPLEDYGLDKYVVRPPRQ